MSATYLQLAQDLDSLTESVFPPLNRTKAPTGGELTRNVWEMIHEIDTMLLSVVGQLRALDTSLQKQQPVETPEGRPTSKRPRQPRVRKATIDDLEIRVAYPRRYRRPSWRMLGKRLRGVIDQVQKKRAKARREEERKQRYIERRQAEDREAWRKKKRRANLKSKPQSKPQSASPPCAASLGAASLGAASLGATGILPVSSNITAKLPLDSLKPNSQDTGQRPVAHREKRVEPSGCLLAEEHAHEDVNMAPDLYSEPEAKSNLGATGILPVSSNVTANLPLNSIGPNTQDTGQRPVTHREKKVEPGGCLLAEEHAHEDVNMAPDLYSEPEAKPNLGATGILPVPSNITAKLPLGSIGPNTQDTGQRPVAHRGKKVEPSGCLFAEEHAHEDVNMAPESVAAESVTYHDLGIGPASIRGVGKQGTKQTDSPTKESPKLPSDLKPKPESEPPLGGMGILPVSSNVTANLPLNSIGPNTQDTGQRPVAHREKKIEPGGCLFAEEHAHEDVNMAPDLYSEPEAKPNLGAMGILPVSSNITAKLPLGSLEPNSQDTGQRPVAHREKKVEPGGCLFAEEHAHEDVNMAPDVYSEPEAKPNLGGMGILPVSSNITANLPLDSLEPNSQDTGQRPVAHKNKKGERGGNLLSEGHAHEGNSPRPKRLLSEIRVSLIEVSAWRKSGKIHRARAPCGKLLERLRETVFNLG